MQTTDRQLPSSFLFPSPLMNKDIFASLLVGRQLKTWHASIYYLHKGLSPRGRSKSNFTFYLLTHCAGNRDESSYGVECSSSSLSHTVYHTHTHCLTHACTHPFPKAQSSCDEVFQQKLVVEPQVGRWRVQPA